MRALTPKQERFVQELVRGGTQRAAYRAAYGCVRWSENAVDSQASRTLASPKVRARYEELQAEAAKLVVWDRARAARDLIEVREIALAHIRKTTGHDVHFDEHSKRDIADLPKASIQVVLNSTAELNRMFGVYDTGDGDGRVAVIDDV